MTDNSAAVAAAMKVLGCSPIRRLVGRRLGPDECGTHGAEWAWDDGCPVAVSVADAAAKAALSDFADALETEWRHPVDITERILAPAMKVVAQAARDRADGIGGGS